MSVRACFFGDSFTNGAGDRDHLGWVGRISAAASARNHDLTTYNLGIRRDTSTDIVDRWKAEAGLRFRPEHDPILVFSYGVNDAVIEDGQMRVVREETMRNTDKILYYAPQWAPCIFIGPPPGADQELNERVGFLSAAMQSHCEAAGVGYFDPFPELLKSSAWMAGVIAGDGVHPDGDGYAVLAELIDQWPDWRRHLP
jgi:acyl-CoA thioesterase I